MHPGLAFLVGRIVESELQTKIRGLSILVRTCYYCVNIKLSGYSFDLQKQKTKFTVKIGVTVTLRNLSQS